VLLAVERAKKAGLSGDDAMNAAFEENSHDAARVGGA
jgi:glutamate synthase (ferredoxin)